MSVVNIHGSGCNFGAEGLAGIVYDRRIAGRFPASECAGFTLLEIPVLGAVQDWMPYFASPFASESEGNLLLLRNNSAGFSENLPAPCVEWGLEVGPSFLSQAGRPHTL